MSKINKMRSLYLVGLCWGLFTCFALVAFPAVPMAQDEDEEEFMEIPSLEDVLSGVESGMDEVVVEETIKTVKLDKVPASNIPSLFWTDEEMRIIDQVKKGIVVFTPVAEEDLEDDDRNDGRYRIPRDLRLSAIIYKGNKDWAFWLNGLRVTPGDLPKEMQYVKVYKDHIEMKWFDAVTGLVYPIRIRPDQRFNIDMRTFVPG